MIAVAWSAVLAFVLPAVCPGCRSAAGPGLCAACVDQAPRIAHACRWCGAPRSRVDAVCSACDQRGLSHIAEVAVGCVYRDLVEQLVGDAKAGARPAAVRALADLLPALPTLPAGPALVVPIPPARGRRPGPHLASALARALARRSGLPYARLLTTTRLAAEQHGLAVADRRRNVDGLFTTRAGVPATVVLVDDLITSGATAAAAAGALRAAGAKHVVLVCLARTPRRDDPEPRETTTSTEGDAEWL